jgi:hypothetical protein
MPPLSCWARVRLSSKSLEGFPILSTACRHDPAASLRNARIEQYGAVIPPNAILL